MATVNLTLDEVSQRVSVTDPSPTVSVIWDEAVQQAIIEAHPGPTIAARAFALMHTAMYEAWAAFDPAAVGSVAGNALQGKAGTNTDANKVAAMSQAAHAVLSELFPDQKAAFDALLASLGEAPFAGSADPSTPAGLGFLVAEVVMQQRRGDGANQEGGYADTTGYEPGNRSPLEQSDITRWTPENIPIDPEDGDPEQSFLTPHWGSVGPFALEAPDALRPAAPQPFFLVEGASLDQDAKTITLADGTVLPVSSALVGTIINPAFIGQAEAVVDAAADLTDREKVIAEFWEDAFGTSFPPGTWMTFGQYVSARDDHTLDEDAKMFATLANAVFDASIATWEAKTHYDYARPVRAIRDLGELGLIGFTKIDPGTGEMIVGEDGDPIYFLRGQLDENGEARTIPATEFITYQTPHQNPSPPFSEYTSGHSSFSAAGAEVLAAYTGSDAFGGQVTFAPGSSRFEPGETPGGAITLAWTTFSQAADEAGRSRIFGGIHFDEGDLNGRALGRAVGDVVIEAMEAYADGSGVALLDGDDLMLGTRADDLFVGAGGDDTILAGFGDDYADGGDGDDRVNGGKGDDTVIGGPGNDALSGRRGDDVVMGEDGEDVLFGHRGVDRMLGGAGDDLLHGGAGDDAIFGDGGDDTLDGGAGRNRMTGGYGADTFVMRADGVAVIKDFAPGDDVLGLADGLAFDDLTFAGRRIVAPDGEVIARLHGDDVLILTEDDFAAL